MATNNPNGNNGNNDNGNNDDGFFSGIGRTVDNIRNGIADFIHTEGEEVEGTMRPDNGRHQPSGNQGGRNAGINNRD